MNGRAREQSEAARRSGGRRNCDTHRDRGARVAHNTLSQKSLVRILYPFHPLVGREFPVVARFKGPPAAVLVQLEDRRLILPLWMTERAAGNVALADQPQIQAQSLLTMADLVGQALSELEPSPFILEGEPTSNKENDDDNHTSAYAGSSRSGSTFPIAGRSQGSDRGHGHPASRRPVGGRRKGGEA